MTEEFGARPEWTALRLTRRWVFVLGVGVAYAITIIIAALNWNQLTGGEHVLLLATVPCFIAGAVFSKRKFGLWLFAPTLLGILSCALLYPESGPRWVAAVLLISYFSYLWAVLAPRWIGLVSVALGPVLLIVVWGQRPENVIPGGLALANGSLAVIQVAIATAMIWWAWNSLRSEADRTDSELALVEARTAESMVVSERAAMWRLTGSRLHESVLNSLRYLVGSSSIDRELLRSFAVVSLPTPRDAAFAEIVTDPVTVARTDVSAPVNKGRLLVTAALAGNAFGGISFLIYLLADQGAKAIPAVILGVTGSVVCLVVVLRRVRIRASWAIPVILIPAILPWLFLSQDLGCRQALVLSPILNIAGFCVMVIAAWATRAAGAVGLLTWGIGGVLIALRMPGDCRQFMAVALVNTLVTLPVIVTVTYAGTAAYERSRRRVMEIRQQEIRERSRAIAAVDINAQLHDVVSEAVTLIRSITDGNPVDTAMRQRLRLIDGRVRAGMQVDPQVSGTFAVLAKSIVDSLGQRGVIVTVKGIKSSTDQRPIDPSALQVIYRLQSAVATRSSIQVISDGHEDFLSMGVDAQALLSVGLKAGVTSSLGDCLLEVDLNDVVDGRAQTATVVLSRRVQG